jgi:hypothetical protein
MVEVDSGGEECWWVEREGMAAWPDPVEGLVAVMMTGPEFGIGVGRDFVSC